MRNLVYEIFKPKIDKPFNIGRAVPAGRLKVVLRRLPPLDLRRFCGAGGCLYGYFRLFGQDG